jgi:hypothetical protein
MLMRPPSNACIATLKPDPCCPSMASWGTNTLSRWTLAVGCERQPILRSGAPKLTPGEERSTRNALMDPDQRTQHANKGKHACVWPNAGTCSCGLHVGCPILLQDLVRSAMAGC